MRAFHSHLPKAAYNYEILCLFVVLLE